MEQNIWIRKQEDFFVEDTIADDLGQDAPDIQKVAIMRPLVKEIF